MNTHIIIAVIGILLGYYARWFVVWLRLRKMEKSLTRYLESPAIMTEPTESPLIEKKSP